MKFRIRNVFLIICVLGSGALLLHVSQKVQISESKLQAIEEQIAQEDEMIKVLRTEWAFLNNPMRLESLAKTYLDLEPVVSDQLTHTPANYFQTPADEALSEEIATQNEEKAVSKIQPASAPQKKNFNQLLQQISAESPQ